MNKTTLLVLDFINDIVHLEGKFTATAKFVHEHQVINHANRVIAFARSKHIPIIFVRVGFSSSYIECPLNSPVFGKAKEYKALELETWGTQFHEALDVQPHDTIITKHRISAFFGTSLEPILSANKIEHLIITGVSTDMAVQTTARDAHDRDYLVTIISDACGAGSLKTHTSTIKELAHIGTILTSTKLA